MSPVISTEIIRRANKRVMEGRSNTVISGDTVYSSFNVGHKKIEISLSKSEIIKSANKTYSKYSKR